MEASEACSSHSSSLDAHNECPYREKKSNINPCTLMPHPEILNATSIDGISSPLSKGLSTERESSTIPKVTAPGHVDETWKYPSPRMFYHALLRKGYATDPQDIDSMLFIHNQLNEGVWKHILEWENFMQPNATGRCQPLLKSFQGRPQKLSPKAWFAHKFLGADKPFDRHDWVIERCGKKVRYVIDYYENGVDQSGSPTMNTALNQFSIASVDFLTANRQLNGDGRGNGDPGGDGDHGGNGDGYLLI